MPGQERCNLLLFVSVLMLCVVGVAQSWLLLWSRSHHLLSLFVIEDNSFNGTIPSEVADLTALTSLSLGEFSDTFFFVCVICDVSGSSNFSLFVAENNALTGTVPPLPLTLTKCSLCKFLPYQNTEVLFCRHSLLTPSACLIDENDFSSTTNAEGRCMLTKEQV
jgi:hypothetical protein